MKNCIVLGSGRSGSSMTAGILSEAGYFMGNDLLPPRDGNPKGFFEDRYVNRLNEDLLTPVAPIRPGPNWFSRWFFRHIPTDGMRWLSKIPVDTHFPDPSEPLRERIRQFTSRRPYCYKDPRFSYTLPYWRPHLAEGTVFICIFRSPATTARSILMDRERAAAHYGDLRISHSRAIEVWTLMYRHILEIHVSSGDWLFLHYDQVLYQDGLQRITDFTGAPVDVSFPDVRLHRSQSDGPVSADAQTVYHHLCRRAGYD